MHLTGITFDSTMSIPQIVKKEEYLTRLVGALTKFTKDQSTTASPGDFDDGFDEGEFSLEVSEALPAETRALVYEIQIHLLCGMTHVTRVITARGLCDKALREYGEENFPLRWVRVVERYLYLGVVGGNDRAKFTEMGLSGISLLTSNKVPCFHLDLRLIEDVWEG
jgi:hypothetical protein